MTDSEIKMWLKQHKKTQQWLADYLAVDLKTVGKWLNGVHKMPPYLRSNIEHLVETALLDDSMREIENRQQPEHQPDPDSPQLCVRMCVDNEIAEEIIITDPMVVAKVNKAMEGGMSESEFSNQIKRTIMSYVEGVEKKEIWLSKKEEFNKPFIEKKEITDDDLRAAAAAINTTPQELIEFILTKAAIKLAKDIAPF